LLIIVHDEIFYKIMKPRRYYSDHYIYTTLKNVKTIALVGASPKNDRDSNICMKFLLEFGYKVIPINPNEVDNLIHGQRCYAQLCDVEESIDMVEIFRNSETVLEIVERAIDMHVDVIWMQLDVINLEAERLALGAGMTVIMDRCPKIELQKLDH